MQRRCSSLAIAAAVCCASVALAQTAEQNAAHVRVVSVPDAQASFTLREAAVTGKLASTFTFQRSSEQREEGELELLQDDVPVMTVKQHKMLVTHLQTAAGVAFEPQPAGSLPPCDDSRRGTTQYVLGDTSKDDADNMYVCMYAGSGAYKWRPLFFSGRSAAPGSSASAVCGNGILEGTEECDDGHEWNSNAKRNACRSNCKNPRCGDGVVDHGEQCEPSLTTLCSSQCQEVANITSCKKALQMDPTAQDGWYALNIQGQVKELYCVMDSAWDGGGWTAIVDPGRGVKPAITLVGPTTGGYVNGDSALGLHSTNSVDRGGNGYSKGTITVPVPAFEEIRMYNLYGERCHRWQYAYSSHQATNMQDFDWGAVKDWESTKGLFPRSSSDPSLPSHCFYVDVLTPNTQPSGVYTSQKGLISLAANAATTIAFGSECGTTTCSMTGTYAHYKYVYVR